MTPTKKGTRTEESRTEEVFPQLGLLNKVNRWANHRNFNMKSMSERLWNWLLLSNNANLLVCMWWYLPQKHIALRMPWHSLELTNTTVPVHLHYRHYLPSRHWTDCQSSEEVRLMHNWLSYNETYGRRDRERQRQRQINREGKTWKVTSFWVFNLLNPRQLWKGNVPFIWTIDSELIFEVN